MAINFPSSPENDQEYTDPGSGTNWIYNSADKSWTMTGAGSSSPFNFRGGYDFTTNNTIGAVESGDLFIHEGADGTVGSGYAGLSGQITAGTLVLWDGTEFVKLSSSVPGYPDTSDPSYQNGTLDERYLSLATDAGAQIVQSTDPTEFKGGVKVSGGSEADVDTGMWVDSESTLNLSLNGKRQVQIKDDGAIRAYPDVDGASVGWKASGALTKAVTKVQSFSTYINSTVSAIPEITHYIAGQDSSVVGEIVKGFSAAGNLNNGTTASYGFYSALSRSTGPANFAFYGWGDAPSFLAGSTYIGGNTTRNTLALWLSTLTEEQIEQYNAGTFTAPADVTTPGDGTFARQWWYNQQDAETQELIDSGELDYPEHLQPANFTDAFALGDNTNINLLSNGTGQFKNIESDQIDIGQPSDFWSLSSSYIGFQSSNQQLGSITTGGGFSTTLYSNGYRDNTGNWKSLDVNSIKGGGQLDVTPNGRLIFTASADTSQFADGQSPGKTRLSLTPSASDNTCSVSLNGSTHIKADAYTTASDLRALRVQADDDLASTPTDFVGVEVIAGTSLVDTNNIEGLRVTFSGGFTPTGVSSFRGLNIVNLADKGDNVYGIYSNVLLGTKNNYNVYAAGSAPSYFEGIVESKGGLKVSDASKGLILTSPDGSEWRLTVDNSGVLTTAAA